MKVVVGSSPVPVTFCHGKLATHNLSVVSLLQNMFKLQCFFLLLIAVPYFTNLYIISEVSTE